MGTLIVLFFFLFNLYKYLRKRKAAHFTEGEVSPQPAVIMFAWGFLLVVIGLTTICKIYDGLMERDTITVAKVDLRSGPGETNASLAEMTEGFEVLVQDEVSGWKQVTTLDGTKMGLTGWIPTSSALMTSGGGIW